MIIYKDILGKLKEAGYTPARLRKEKIIGEATRSALRNSETVSLKTIDLICQLLHCRIEDIVEILPDKNTPA